MTESPSRLRIPAALQPGREDDAAALVATYLTRRSDGSPEFSGAAFETIGAAWDTPGSPYEITPADLVAVSTLSVVVPPRAALDVLDVNAARISALLARIDPAEHLVDAGDALLFDYTSPGSELWLLLRARRGRTGLGPTATSKLLARKRPNLFPIHEAGGAEELAWRKARGFWRQLWVELRADDRALWRQLCRVKQLAGADHPVSPLRILDIVAWMDSPTKLNRVPAQPNRLPAQRPAPIPGLVPAPDPTSDVVPGSTSDLVPGSTPGLTPGLTTAPDGGVYVRTSIT